MTHDFGLIEGCTGIDPRQVNRQIFDRYRIAGTPRFAAEQRSDPNGGGGHIQEQPKHLPSLESPSGIAADEHGALLDLNQLRLDAPDPCPLLRLLRCPLLLLGECLGQLASELPCLHG